MRNSPEKWVEYACPKAMGWHSLREAGDMDEETGTKNAGHETESKYHPRVHLLEAFVTIR